MNKPISTWTQTFYKLGYTLRRVWRDEPDYTDNYTPLAIEVLEDRQMLSGFGGDDPLGGGGTGGGTGGSDGSGGDAGEFDNTPGSGSGALAGGANDITGVTDARPGAGYSEQAALSLSEHWRADSNASYAWNQGPVLLSYFGTRTSGTTNGVNYHAEVSEYDEDLGTYLVSFYTYNYTITVSRSSDAATGGMGGFGTPSADWYKEHLVVTVGGFTIETDNQLIANDFLDDGQFNNFNSATFKQIGTHSGTANYTFTGTLSSITPNSYSRIDIVLNEQFQQSFNYQTTVDSFWDRDGLPGDLTVAGTVQVSGGSQSNRHTTYDSSTTSTGRNFNITGNSSGSSNQTITYQNASLTVATTGFVPVDISAADGANLYPTNPDGTYVALPTEGSRHQLKLNGTQTSTATSSSNFSGNGTIQFQGSNAVRTGVVNYAANADATQTNDYVRTYTSDQTILGATILYGMVMAPDGSVSLQRKIEKGASEEIDIAVLHSHSQTTDKNRSESELKYNLKHEYTGDGKVEQTTQAVNSPTGLGFSFYRLRDDYNTETHYLQIEQLQYTKPLDNSTEFRRTDGTVKVLGPETRLTTFATSTTSAQPGFTHETVSTGQVFVTGTTDLTQTSNQTSINSFKSRKYESQMASAAIELTLDGSGNVESPPPMAGWRDSSSHAERTVSSTQRLHDTILRHWNYAATGVVTIADNSTYRSYTTAYSGSDEWTIKTSLDASDGQGNTHSDAYEQTISNTNTAYGLGSLTGRQDYWLSGEGATIAAAAVGEASVIIQSLVITFTPRPTPTNNDDEDDVEAVASGSSNEDKYDRTQSGTSRQIRLGGFFDTGNNEGFDRVSGQTSTPAGTTTPATTSTYFNRDSWNKTTGGDSTYSLTDLYSFNADDSFSIQSTGWSEDLAEDDGDIGYRTTLGSKSGNVGQSPAMSAITAEGQSVATDAQWDALANQMNDDAFTGFGDDFSLSRLIDTRHSNETASDRVRTEYNLTRTFTPTTFEVPADAGDGTGNSGDDSNSNTTATDSESDTGETRTVEGYEITSSGSTTVVATSSYSIQHSSGQTELLYARQTSSGNYEYVPGQGFGTGPSYRWLSNGRSITELAGEGNSESYSSSTTVITSYLSDGLITIQTISDIDGDTESLATAKTTTSDRLWQDDYAAGHGRIAAARSSSLPPAGPNLSSSSSYRYDSNLTLTIDPSLFPPPSDADDSSDSSGTYDENGGQSNYTPGSGTSGSGTSTNPDGSGSSNSEGSTGPTLAAQYQNMQYGVSRWDAADKGFDLTGTVTETSSSNFSHKEQLSQSSEDLMRMDDGHKVGAVQFQASSGEEISRTSSSDLLITHGEGTQFGITEASDEVTTNHSWTNKQISSRSEYREYAAPTSAPPTTMTALRTASATSSQSLLGDPPAGSELVSSATHRTFYYSPLSDVTKTVKNWIVPYESDGSPNASPILYRYSDEVKVNVTAWVEKIGNVFNGSSTLRSKSTFTESDQGTIETYRGLERQGGNSFNNWTVTYVPVETHTGGITQSITDTKPAADNTITIPNHGTQTTVAPGGEYHSGTTTLSTYLTVQKPTADFVGEFTTKTGYVSTSVTTSSNGGSSDDDYSQTSGGSGAQDGDSEISLNLGDLKNLSDQELSEAIKLFFIMHEGLTPDFEAFEAMCNEGFIRVEFYRSSPYFFDLHSGSHSRPIPGTHTDGPHYFWRIYLDRNEIEKHGLTWAVTEFRKRLETLNSYPFGDRNFRNRRKLFADSLNASTLAGTPSAANTAAQDAYFQGLASEPRAALAAAAREAEKELMLLGERGVLLIRMTPQGGFVLAVVDIVDKRTTWQSKAIGLGTGIFGLGAAGVFFRYAKAVNQARKARWPWAKPTTSVSEMLEGGGRCKMWAEKILDAIGGDLIHIRPNQALYPGARAIGPLRTIDGRLISDEFLEHYAVLNNGRVYDRITGPDGLPLEEYRKLFDWCDGLLFMP